MKNEEYILALLNVLGTTSKVAVDKSKKRSSFFFSVALLYNPPANISTSLLTKSKARGIGKKPLSANPIETLHITALSAVGSKKAPKIDLWLYLLAIYPSNQSLNVQKSTPTRTSSFSSCNSEKEKIYQKSFKSS